jgi:ornithine--oxo-acid transaminase
MHEGIRPDLLIVGKALAGGFYPVSAVLSSKEILGVYKPGDHGSTFGGNALTCAVGAAVLRYILENDVVGNVRRVGALLKNGLEALRQEQPLISEVRGEGLLIAVDLAADVAAEAVRLGLEEGVLLNNTDATTLRLAPPLILSEAEAQAAVEKLRRVLRRVEAPSAVQPSAA